MSDAWMQAIRDELASGDTLVDVTTSWSQSPEYVIGSRASDRAIARARALYLDGVITIEQFEAAVAECLTPSA